MRGKLLTAAIAILLIASLAGCKNSTAAVPNWNSKSGDSAQSVIERKGVHDGIDAEAEDGGGTLGNTPNWNDHLNTTNTKGITNPAILPGGMAETATRAGESVKDGAEDAARDLRNAVRSAAS